MGDAAERIGVSPKQAKYATRFFIDVGFWKSTGRDIYAATPQGREFGALWEPAQDRARASLGRLLQDQWFTDTVREALVLGPVPVDDLLSALQNAAGAHDGHRALLIFLIEWLTVARLVEQTEDGRVTPGPALVFHEQAAKAEAEAPARNVEEPFIPQQKESNTVHPADEAPTHTAGFRDADPYALSVDLRLTWEEVSFLEPNDLSCVIRVMAAVTKARRESAQRT